MNVIDFAKYVIDNITRATLGNALNITNKFIANKDSKPQYDFVTFQKYVYDYVYSLCSANKLKPDTAMYVYCLGNDCMNKLQSKYKYNQTMVIDDYIMGLWRLFN